MTENNDQTILPYSTDNLLVNFTKSRFGLYLLVAVVIHVIFIAITSISYINDRWIDPEGSARRKAELEAAQSNQMAAAAAVPPVNIVSGSNMSSNVSTAAVGTGSVADAAGSNANAPANRTNTAIMRQITDTAKPSEIPKEPDNLGISIKDTNPQ
ncbi:MAG: hypothetical protein KKE37_01310 [Verrucomicrobia bacterium]|nr:hypothetical protein [Verrucomicrobiota bacterium]MBU4427972.1 hypothetical protein [Verrucomicrobiota bacterium]MCG2681560.1 hypothetical protein [Kiritimatiellia bacterium]